MDEINDIHEDGFSLLKDHRSSSYRDDAKAKLKALFDVNRREVYYVRQLQVMFEEEIFHWITHQAIIELEGEKYLKRIVKSFNMSESSTLLHFFAHHTNRYAERQANNLTKLIEEYSQSHITEGCGNRAELLFAAGLAERGFMPIGRSLKSYRGREWTETGHNLDFIFEKDGIAYGCEIKNQLPYIGKELLQVKLEICDYLQLRPLLIMRYAPKTFIYEIQRAGGYAMIFEAQIYELGQRVLVEKMRKTFGKNKADSPRAIPAGIIDRFERWHNKHRNP